MSASNRPQHGVAASHTLVYATLAWQLMVDDRAEENDRIIGCQSCHQQLEVKHRLDSYNPALWCQFPNDSLDLRKQ